MQTKPKDQRQSHLEYYQQHSIAPVRYDLSSSSAHFDRRRSLYNKLGLIGLAFQGSNVLEVAAGTGHNSLYVAHQRPSSLTLLEPNPTCLAHIEQAYGDFRLQHTAPRIISQKLEDYQPEETFDIVLCENWLGISAHETQLLLKLTEFVKPEGVLVLTTVSPIGFVPNLLRRFFSNYIASPQLSFLERTELIEESYAPHLNTLSSMTRNTTDWVHDNMLNPAYFSLCLSAPKLLSTLPVQYEVLGEYPSFNEDWRWFKGLHGNDRLTNQHFLSEYWLKCHNFLDSRNKPSLGLSSTNQRLEETALSLMRAIELNEDALFGRSDTTESVQSIRTHLTSFIQLIPPDYSPTSKALAEVIPLLDHLGTLKPKDMSTLSEFSYLFGKETSYISLQRCS